MATNTRVSLTIEGIDPNGKTSTNKIAYVNPTLSNNIMKTFAEKCNALTNDTYIGTTKTTEEDITNGGDSGKTEPQIGEFPTFTYRQMANVTITGEGFSRTATFTNSPFDEGTLFAVKPPFKWIAATAHYTNGKIIFYVDSIVPEGYDDDYQTSAGTFAIYIPETTTTAAAIVTVSLVSP